MNGRRGFVVALCATVGAALAGCGDGAGGGNEGTGSSSSKGGAHADLFRDAPIPEGKSARPVVKLTTTAGEILVELDRKAAPETVENFLGYVRAGFYKDTVFHRVLPGVLAHGGGRDKDGKAKDRGPAVKFEGENGKSHRKGTLAMWRDAGDPQSATSEFFFNLADNDGKKAGAKNFDFQSASRGPAAFGYCVFGKAKDAASLAVLEKIGATPTADHPEFAGEKSKPTDPPRVLAAEIVSE